MTNAVAKCCKYAKVFASHTRMQEAEEQRRREREELEAQLVEQAAAIVTIDFLGCFESPP